MRKNSFLRLTQHGVEHVPMNWTQSRVKYLGAYINGYPFKPKDWGTVGRPILRIQDLSSPNEEPNRYDGEILSRYLVRPRDILISWSASLGVYRWAGEEAWLNQHIFRVVLDNKRVRDDFFVWLAEWFINEMDREVHGSTMQHLTADAFGGFPVLLPPHDQQARIAKYLDRETARLDALVAAKERVLGLLAEKRRALITRAVTHGLDPRAPLRDSGIPWLGKIPAHWEISKFTWRIFIIEGQVDPEIEPYVNMPLIAPNHLESGTGRLLFTETAADQGAISGKYLCQRNDVIYSKIRPALRKAMLAVEQCLCSADMYPLRAREGVQPEFLLFFLLSEPFSTWAVLESNRVAMPKINRVALGGIRIPLPPSDEQRAIVEHIAGQVVKLDNLRTSTEQTITLLKERRAALIAAAVTGQIDVENAA